MVSRMRTFLRSLCFLLLLNFSFEVSAGLDSTYDFSWLDQDKEIFVLQNRKYEKKKKLYIDVGYGLTTSNAFVDAKAIQFRGGYFFSESWGIEGIYSSNSGVENETAAAVRNTGGAGSRPFRRIVQNYMGGMLMWSPFYMKMNTFNKVIYVDWMFGLGYGILKETNNREEFQNQTSSTELAESHSGIIWETALQFYLSESWRVRTIFTGIHYSALDGTGLETITESNIDIVVALGLSF